MGDSWVHVGRVWTHGGPLLAVDAALLGSWHGLTGDDYDQITTLGWQVTSIPVGTGRAVLVGDGAVRDDGWTEIFQTPAGAVAMVQADGPGYQDVLARALKYPDEEDGNDDDLTVRSHRLAIFNAASDGGGPYAVPLADARPGVAPHLHGPYSSKAESGLAVPAPCPSCTLRICRHTRLGDGSRFARWMLLPRKLSA